MWEQRKKQPLCSTCLRNQDRICTTNHGYCQLIFHSFEEVHYVNLRDDDTYYKMVSLIRLLNHLSYKMGGLEVTDVVALIGELRGYWANDPRVPQ